MSNPYEVEHNITPSKATTASHRPDMSSFFSALSQISTSPRASSPHRADRRRSSSPHNNPHAVPSPVSYATTARLLQDQLLTFLRQQDPRREGDADDRFEHDDDDGEPADLSSSTTLLTTLLSSLESSIASPPTEVEGVSQAYLDSLERVDKRALRASDACPICAEKYLDDAYPLVVRLPCHDRHWFCLECVGPWLRFKGTCPLDRKPLGERKRRLPDKPGLEEEEEEDNMGDYA